MNKFFFLSCITILATGCASGAPSVNDEGAQVEQKIVVATSFYPLTHFTEQVGGDLVDVQQIASPGTDPHSYEPTPKQMQQIFASDLLIFNGAGQDPYADRILDELKANSVRVLVAIEMVEKMTYNDDEDHDEDDDHDDEEDHEADDDHNDEEDDHGHGEWDPHVWLDPIRAIQMVEMIAQELAEIQPLYAEQFTANADSYIAQLQSLHQEMQTGLSDCSLDAIIVSHDAYRYLANRYGFHTLEIAGLSPSAEPSPARLAELVAIANAEGISHVFFETQVSPALSETLAAEINADTLILHSIEALTQQEQLEAKTYIDLQRSNLHNLRTALQCS